jgi:predicted nucleic acid-binding protein
MIALVERVEGRNQAVSALAVLEVRSAVRRRQRTGDILAADADTAVGMLQSEIARIVEYAITPVVIAEAARLVDQHILRALDAIQLATAIVARDGTSSSRQVFFISADVKLLTAAASEGFSTWNPASGIPAP